MDSIELIRLQQGQKLLGKIEKLKAQIKILNSVTHIQLKTKKVNEGGVQHCYTKQPDEVLVVDFDIPINITDKIPHPFAFEASNFVHKFSMILQEQVKELKNEFSKL